MAAGGTNDGETTSDDSIKSDSAKSAGSQAAKASRKEKVLPPAAKKKLSTRAASADRPADTTGRYTAPVPAAKKGPSPRWVPVLMFALWGIGLLMIIGNYMGVLPGSGDAGNGWYLVGGLGAILGGIITATQYR